MPAEVRPRDALRRVPAVALAAAILLAACGPTAAPRVFAFVVALLHAGLVAFHARLAVGAARGVAAARREAGVDWRARAASDSFGDAAFDDVRFVVILPFYRESDATMRGAVAWLADHAGARRRYTVVLAVEGREPGAAARARAVAAEHAGALRSVEVTVHPDGIPGEAPGKGSNVAWAAGAARDAGPHAVVVVLDADARAPEAFFDRAAHLYCASTPEERARSLYAAVNLFDVNALEVPAAVRIADIAWGLGALSNYALPGPWRFPASNYALPVQTLWRVGGFDADEFSLGEDLHMFNKAFIETGGELEVRPIYAPVSCSNVHAPTYAACVAARAVQAHRHAFGLIDLAYVLERAAAGPRCGTPAARLAALVYRLCEIHLFFALAAVLVPAAARPGARADPVAAALLAACDAARLFLCVPALAVAAVAYERLHARFARPGARRRAAHLFDWAWAPVAGACFVVVPQWICYVQQAFTGRLRYVVSGKPHDHFPTVGGQSSTAMQKTALAISHGMSG